MKKVTLLVCLLALTLLITNISAKSKQPTATIINNVASKQQAARVKLVNSVAAQFCYKPRTTTKKIIIPKKCFLSQLKWIKKVPNESLKLINTLLIRKTNCARIYMDVKNFKAKKNTLERECWHGFPVCAVHNTCVFPEPVVIPAIHPENAGPATTTVGDEQEK